MKKLVPPDIFLMRKEDKNSLVLFRLDFFEFLFKVLKKNPEKCRLAFPETILKEKNLGSSFLLHTDGNELVYSENLDKHTIQKFYRRCTYFKDLNFPLCAVKVMNSSRDLCVVTSKISDCENYWESNDSVLIQRFIVPGMEAISKARITYFVQEETFVGKLIWKHFDGTFKLNRHDHNVEEEINLCETVKDQMVSLKEILQDESNNTEIIEIQSDFIQDRNGRWYFINFIFASCETVKKKFREIKKVKEELVETIEVQAETPKTDLKEEILKDVYSLLCGTTKKKKRNKKRVKKF